MAPSTTGIFRQRVDNFGSEPNAGGRTPNGSVHDWNFPAAERELKRAGTQRLHLINRELVAAARFIEVDAHLQADLDAVTCQGI